MVNYFVVSFSSNKAMQKYNHFPLYLTKDVFFSLPHAQTDVLLFLNLFVLLAIEIQSVILERELIDISPAMNFREKFQCTM